MDEAIKIILSELNQTQKQKKTIKQIHSVHSLTCGC